MTSKTRDTLAELHVIRETLNREETGISAHERVTRSRQAAETLLKKWGLTLTVVEPPSQDIQRRAASN